MPNWVKNRLTITGKNAKKIIKTLLTKDELEPNRKTFDFNKITPMPKSLDIEAGSLTNTCIELYMTYLNPMVDYYGKDKMDINKFLKIKNRLNSQRPLFPYDFQYAPTKIQQVIKNLAKYYKHNHAEKAALELGKIAIDNVSAYGYKDWYDWSIANWGTKWNACDTYIKGNVIEFDTAWSPVPKVIERLSKMYPDLEIDYLYAEEQMGVSTGHFIFKNGQTCGQAYEDYDVKAYETSCELWGETKRDKFDRQQRKDDIELEK